MNRERRASNWHRAYGSAERVAFVQSLPCCVSGVRGGVEVAHVRTGGMGRKADACWTVPLARDLHRWLHQHGLRTFERVYGVDLDAAARRTDLAWQRHLTGPAQGARRRNLAGAVDA